MGPAETPLRPLLLEHGASIALRHGCRVAVHYGSVVAETAVCLRSVGLTDRFGRVTFELRGPAGLVGAALARAGDLDGAVRSARPRRDNALVRCEPADKARCRRALDDPDLLVTDATARHVALGLVGPRARDVLHAARLEDARFATTVLLERNGAEILVAPGAAPDAWRHLLRAGAPYGIACVGFDALEHLAVSRHVAAAATDVPAPPEPV